MKPMLASDWNESKQTFPVIAQPKIDGVRGLNMDGKLTGRSLKPFKNEYTTEFFSHPAFAGMDGEFAAEDERHPDLCRLTTSALGTIKGEPWLMWHVFDYLPYPSSPTIPYHERLQALRDRVRELGFQHPQLAGHLRVVDSRQVPGMHVLLSFDTMWVEEGYEGTILRAPGALHKSGRSTVKEGGLLRIKRFLDGEAMVIGVTEGRSNQNEATTNELGYTERSSHQANMVPNGLVGTLQCRALADVGPIKAGAEITVSAGRLTANERAHYFRNQNEIIGRVIKYKTFPKGAKDKLRFPTFQAFRSMEDMS